MLRQTSGEKNMEAQLMICYMLSLHRTVKFEPQVPPPLLTAVLC